MKTDPEAVESFLEIKVINMENQEEFQEVFLDDDDVNTSVSSNKYSLKREVFKKSMVLPIQEYVNTDTDDCYKSLTPVNEVQSFVPLESSSATISLRTSLSLTSDSSTPKLESRKLPHAHPDYVTITQLKKSSTSNTLKGDVDAFEVELVS